MPQFFFLSPLPCGGSLNDQLPTVPSALIQRAEFPNGISRKNLGNFQSRAFRKILFPVPTQYRLGSGFFPAFIEVFWEKYQNLVLLETFPNCTEQSHPVLFIFQIFSEFFRATGPEKSSLFPVLPIWEMKSSLVLSRLV